jgi:hypothetical protein
VLICILEFIPLMITSVKDEGVVFVGLVSVSIIKTLLYLFQLPQVNAVEVIHGVLQQTLLPGEI